MYQTRLHFELGYPISLPGPYLLNHPSIDQYHLKSQGNSHTYILLHIQLITHKQKSKTEVGDIITYATQYLDRFQDRYSNNCTQTIYPSSELSLILSCVRMTNIILRYNILHLCTNWCNTVSRQTEPLKRRAIKFWSSGEGPGVRADKLKCWKSLIKSWVSTLATMRFPFSWNGSRKGWTILWTYKWICRLKDSGSDWEITEPRLNSNRVLYTHLPPQFYHIGSNRCRLHCWKLRKRKCSWMIVTMLQDGAQIWKRIKTMTMHCQIIVHK